MSKTVPVRMPKLTLAAVEGTFLKWLVEDGHEVVEDEPIYLVETEKVEVEVPSPASGVLHYGDAEADVVYEVGTQLATIEVADGS